MCSGIVCVEKTVRFPVWQESAAKYCFLCGFMICCICGGNAAIRRCAHKRRTGCGTQHPLRVLSGTCVLLAAAPTSPPCFRHRRRSAPLQLLFTRYPECRARAIFSWNLVLPGMLEGRKGGCTMTFEQVVLLLTLLGGAIYVTFEITWTVSHSDDKKKK